MTISKQRLETISKFGSNTMNILKKKEILKHDGYYYVVNPYALEWKNDHYYLIGFSLKHQKIAHFRVDRLTSVENLETCFMPVEGFDVASYTNKMVDMFTIRVIEGSNPVM